MWLIRVTYRPWARYSNNDSLPIERPNSSSCLVQDTDYCNSLNLMLGSQGGRREMLVFCLYWSPEELAAKMDEGMPQQQDPWTCHWEWGQTCKKQKHPSTLFSAGGGGCHENLLPRLMVGLHTSNSEFKKRPWGMSRCSGFGWFQV